VDPPERVAGYFKLNRTHDAHMFYFFYESRSKGANDPVILWMTGEPMGFGLFEVHSALVHLPCIHYAAAVSSRSTKQPNAMVSSPVHAS
jgi:hypothetical protein